MDRTSSSRQKHTIDSAAFLFVTSEKVQIISCSIYASWVPRETYLVPAAGLFIYSPFTFPGRYWDNLDDDHTRIKINADWANLALPSNKTIIPLASKHNSLPFSKRQSVQDWQVARGIGSAFSIVITDALSRIQNDVVLTGHSGGASWYLNQNGGNGYFSVNDPLFDVYNATPLKMALFRNGYSYSTSGITRMIALTILFVHMLIALVHTILLLRIGWESHRMRSLKDLFLLAASSPPAKASPSATGLYTVKVRKTTLRQLGIVFDGHRKPRCKLLENEKRRPKNIFVRLFRSECDCSTCDPRDSSKKSAMGTIGLKKPSN